MYDRLLSEEIEGGGEASFLDHTGEGAKSFSVESFSGSESASPSAPERPGRWLRGPELVAWVIERACGRKANLKKEEADLIIDDHASCGRLMYYYKCQFCGSYHLTSKPAVGNNQIAII